MIESVTYKFAKCLQRRFGVIPGVTDKNYVTNSYHVHVTEEIDAFTKLKFEAEFQALSPGGAINKQWLYIIIYMRKSGEPINIGCVDIIYANGPENRKIIMGKGI